MKVGKPKSKRTPVRLRHKIEKASAAKQRKARKLAKSNPQWRSRLKKDPGIPNLFPYKDSLLRKIEEDRMRKEEEQRARREEQRTTRGDVADVSGGDAKDVEENNDEDEEEEEEDEVTDYDSLEDAEAMDADDVVGDTNPMAALLASARARASEFEQSKDAEPDESLSEDTLTFSMPSERSTKIATTSQSSSQSHTSAFNALLSSSEILLYVIDARDPATTRSRRIERQMMSDPSKRLFLILNKIDLIPPSTARKWLRHLRRSLPTLPLLSDAALSHPSYAREHAKSGLTPQNTTIALLKALKTRAASAKKQTTVGILGYPNTGKSTIINSLLSTLHNTPHKRQKTAAPVGAEAGVTTALRSIKLDGNVKLLDAPGIVFPADAPPSMKTGPSPTKSQEQAEQEARVTLLNAVPSHSLNNPVAAVSLLLERSTEASASNDTLQKSLGNHYGIPTGFLPSGDDATKSFLIAVARARGRLGKGGVPNLEAAARTVLGDWWAGRILGGWVEPPTIDGKMEDDERAVQDEKRVVTGWAAEFKLDGLWGDDVLVEHASGVEEMQE